MHFTYLKAISETKLSQFMNSIYIIMLRFYNATSLSYALPI